MTQITTSEIEATLKSTYGDKWRQALLIHMIIGVGGIIAKTIRSIDPERKRDAKDNEQPVEITDQVTRLEQDPLGYVRSKSRRVAEILEDELHSISQIAAIFTFLHDSRHIGDLIQAIGAQALERLKDSEKRKSRTFPEELIRRAWRQTDIGVRQGTQIVVRWVYLISAAYSHS